MECNQLAETDEQNRLSALETKADHRLEAKVKKNKSG